MTSALDSASAAERRSVLVTGEEVTMATVLPLPLPPLPPLLLLWRVPTVPQIRAATVKCTQNSGDERLRLPEELHRLRGQLGQLAL